MECGCIFEINAVIDIKYCPTHNTPRCFFTRPCNRCGKIEKTYNLTNPNFLCEPCNNLVQQAKVVCNNHGLKYIDPALWHKELEDVLSDIMVNVFLGYEEIQIDTPIEVQHQKKTVRIDFDQKRKNLSEIKKKIRQKERIA